MSSSNPLKNLGNIAEKNIITYTFLPSSILLIIGGSLARNVTPNLAGSVLVLGMITLFHFCKKILN
jgi:hypothetical protein